MLNANDIYSLSDFQRNAREFITRLKADRRPVVLTVNGKAEVVVQDAQTYQDLIDRLERAEAIAAIRTGMAEIERGEYLEAHEAFEGLRQKHGIPR